ncbi:MAG TPA: hypothetical protein DEB40_00995 [Elusimicrobia bacterium]|nr:hypothetical protein [Elusimicrobiota bacterium]HBT60306.1 hypothetical protein [Elusimicrobiota bacterium]
MSAKGLKGFDLVYLGSEFCQNRLPSEGEIAGLRAVYRGPIVLVTALMTTDGLVRAERLLVKIARGRRKMEVVVNDWGFLHLLRQKYRAAVKPILGRLLMWEIAEMDKAFLNAFCRERGIDSVETDNDLILGRLAGFAGAVNFHYPYRFRSMSRFCPFGRRFNSGPCARSCAGVFARLSAKNLKGPLFMSGNAYFSENRPSRGPCIGRLVKDFFPRPDTAAARLPGSLRLKSKSLA